MISYLLPSSLSISLRRHSDMIDPVTMTAIASIIASLAATANSAGNTAKTVVETLENKKGNEWKLNAESMKVLEDFSSLIGRSSFPVFDGRNYKIWSLKMKNLLKSCDLWDLVEKGYKEEGRNDKASKNDGEKDSLIFQIILLAVDESVGRCLVNAKNSKEAWEALKTQYEEMENIRGGPGGGTFGGVEPTSSRFNPRSVDDLFADLSEILRSFGGRMDGGPGMRDGRFGSMFGDHMFSSFGEGGGGSMRQSAHRKAPPIEQTIPCSLEDLYKGTTKKFKISREIVVRYGKRMPVEEILTINIKPGWKKDTKITFSEKGNECLGIIPADLVFIIDEKPHKLFTRDGNDLVATLKINLVEAPGYTVHLTTLDDRNLTIPINSMIHPNYEEVVPREGMPIPGNPSKKGNLRIKFDIKFPTIRLTPSQKAAIKQLLGSSIC